jgi:hypothetical protein
MAGSQTDFADKGGNELYEVVVVHDIVNISDTFLGWGSEIEACGDMMKEPCTAKKERLTGYVFYPEMRRSEEGVDTAISGPPVRTWRSLSVISAPLPFLPSPVIGLPDRLAQSSLLAGRMP